MITFLQNIFSLFHSLRNTLFILLFLLAGNYHQAVEKQYNSKVDEDDLSFMYAPTIEFNPQYIEYIEGEIDRLLQRRGFNGSVLLAHQGQAVYEKSRGLSRYRNRIPLAENDNIFQLASVSKQFTAIATLILWERGHIGLDDKVTSHIEGFPYPEITIRQLLNHTSGLQNYFYIIDNYWNKERLPGHDDMLDMIVKHDLPLNFTPGRRFSYSNTGYAFLAMLIREVSGHTFASFIEENIFTPLRMEHSFVFEPGVCLEQISANNNLAFGHERNGRWRREIPVDFNDGITGDKGIFSTTSDLLKWDNALENNTLISKEARELAFERGSLRSGYRISYGFGYRIKRLQGEEIIYHNGWWKGFRSAYTRLPGNTLIVILNNTTASLTGLDNQIRRIIQQSPYPVFPQEDQQQEPLFAYH